MQRVKSKAPAAFKAQVNDAEKRLNILFDHLNNETLLKLPTISEMVELADAMRARDYDRAQAIHVSLLTHRTDECTTWMVSSGCIDLDDPLRILLIFMVRLGLSA